MLFLPRVLVQIRLTAVAACLCALPAGVARAQYAPLPPPKLEKPAAPAPTQTVEQAQPTAPAQTASQTITRTPGGSGMYPQPMPQGSSPAPMTAKGGVYLQPSVGVTAPQPGAQAKSGVYLQPSPGAYAQPSTGAGTPAAVPARTGVFLQPGAASQPVASVAAPLAESGPRRISLGFTPAPASAPAPVPAAPAPAPMASAPDRSSLPPVMPVGSRADRASVGPTMSKATARQKSYRKMPDVLVKPGEPMMDDLGMQRIDPEGKPMFYPSVLQKRDKNGLPVFDAKKQPVYQTANDLGYDEHGRHIRPERVDLPKTTVITIERGAFTVDGIVGKVQLNYDVGELKYLYLYVPDVGVTIVSDKPFPGATVQRGAFHGNMLTVKTEEHVLQISSEKALVGKRPMSAYVSVDRGFLLPGAKFPVLGYGATTQAPYVWPGSKAQEKLAGTADYAPPVPKNLKPKLLSETCATGVVCAGTAPPAVVAPVVAAPAEVPSGAGPATAEMAPPAAAPAGPAASAAEESAASAASEAAAAAPAPAKP